MAEAVATESPELTTPADATPIPKLAQRDGAIALAAISVWAAADTWHATTGLGLAAMVALLDALFAGAALAILAHEWGHFAGARLFGGIAPTRKLTSLFPIFDFDLARSPAAAFRAMGVGGNLGHWGLVLLLAVGLPLDSVGRIALLSATFGFAVGASITEFPIIRRAYAGASAAESFAGLSREKLKRDRWMGIGAGVALFLLLAL